MLIHSNVKFNEDCESTATELRQLQLTLIYQLNLPQHPHFIKTLFSKDISFNSMMTITGSFCRGESSTT